jgi:exosortase A
MSGNTVSSDNSGTKVVNLEIKPRREEPARPQLDLIEGSGKPAAAPVASDPDMRMVWIVLGIGLVALVWLFRGTAAAAVDTWYSSDTFQHGFLIIPIVLYLTWEKRATLARMTARPTIWGVALFAVAGFGWLLGNLGGVLVVQQFALIGMIQSTVLAVLGWRMARVLVFPLFFLLFAVPFGEFLVPPLQDLTAEFVVVALRLFDIPVFLDGIFLSIPTGNFEVARACAGVRFLIATLALGFLFSHLTFKLRRNWVYFIGLSIIIPIVANGIRAFGIVAIAYMTNNEIAVGVDHIVYGWVFFAFVTFALLGVGMMFREARQPLPAQPVIDAAAMAPMGSVPISKVITVAAVVLLVGAVWPAYAQYSSRVASDVTRPVLAAPEVGGGWRMLPEVDDDWKPSFVGNDIALRRTFVKDGREVQLFIAYYAYQRQGAEVVSFDNSIEIEDVWVRAGSGSAVAPVDGEPLKVGMIRMLGQRGGRVVYHWNWVGGAFESSPYLTKLSETIARLRGAPSAAAYIAVAADYSETPDQARATLNEFLASVGSFQTALTRAARR